MVRDNEENLVVNANSEEYREDSTGDAKGVSFDEGSFFFSIVHRSSLNRIATPGRQHQ